MIREVSRTKIVLMWGCVFFPESDRKEMQAMNPYAYPISRKIIAQDHKTTIFEEEWYSPSFWELFNLSPPNFELTRGADSNQPKGSQT